MLTEPIIIQLPKIHDVRGNLSFVESLRHIPFNIERTFWIYDVPGGETRGGHAYKTTHEFIIALSGSFDVVVDNGKQKQRFSLNRSYYGLYIPAGFWRHMENFSTNALAVVLASTHFTLEDYCYDYQEFLAFQSKKNYAKICQPAIEKPCKVISDSKKTTVFDCHVLHLPVNHRDKGNITVVDNNITLPFRTQRIYYLYDVPGGENRGGHAHKNLHQLVIAASGSFEVVLDDGKVKRSVLLNRPYQCLYIVPGIWRELVNFSSGSICLVLASDFYSEEDYIREYNNYINFKNYEI